ncbi:hypothetical protein GYMLUDRAFT_245741 [Collybiopsis luxurians FD-317 M1]|uniref:F-box domain-containing protein n=1 Tax=Collybiopsis luxurians FD-317 M1 TaxID=944289 RepID=A0A0D0CKL1_9AGAR|nr:hypothetical protein GYMLUDRAFT_245741 [Collybiopsis luxurians FD-317 M1]
MRTQCNSLLPLSIIRMILENIAIEDVRGAAQLTRISHLVQHWIDPILYSNVELLRDETGRAFLRTTKTAKRRLISATVRSLSVCFNPRDDQYVPQILLACPAVIDLTIYTVPTQDPLSMVESYITSWNIQQLYSALSCVRPRRLQMQLGKAARLYNPLSILHKTFFQFTTHLVVTDKWEFWTTWSGYRLLPSLTHIAFDLETRAHQSDNSSLIIRSLSEVLEDCAKLMLCIVRILPLGVSREYVKRNLPRMQDRRLVFLFDTEHFLSGKATQTAGETSIWEVAEDIICNVDMTSDNR